MPKKIKSIDEADADALQAMLADPDVDGKPALRQKLSAMLGSGAVPCKACGALPHAMLRRPAVSGNLPVYEVGCLAHGGAKAGDEPATAVRRWNAAQE